MGCIASTPSVVDGPEIPGGTEGRKQHQSVPPHPHTHTPTPPPQPAIRPLPPPLTPPGPPPPLSIFRLSQLAEATKGFSHTCKIGTGTLGPVYKGKIGENIVAIKKVENKVGDEVVMVDKKQSGAEMGPMDSLMEEIKILGQLHHPNLVKLIGYCMEEEEAFLVYEYVANRSLDQYIGSKERTLPWNTRLQIAVDSAEALHYLHEKRIVHRDFKPPNILLDENFRVKLTDFGFAKALNADVSRASTRIMGTLGYLDPSYLITGELNLTSDVYSFGILLLELLTGRHAIDERFEGENLVQWVGTRLQPESDIKDILDSSISEEFKTKKVRKSAQAICILVRRCIDSEPSSRPPITQIENFLKAIQEKALKSDTV